jgi:predicted amidophosphoribosyltransferase
MFNSLTFCAKVDTFVKVLYHESSKKKQLFWQKWQIMQALQEKLTMLVNTSSRNCAQWFGFRVKLFKKQ